MIDILFTLSLANFPRQGLSVAQPASVFTPLNNINLHVYFFFASLLPAVISPPGYSVDQKKPNDALHCQTQVQGGAVCDTVAVRTQPWTTHTELTGFLQIPPILKSQYFTDSFSLI